MALELGAEAESTHQDPASKKTRSVANIVEKQYLSEDRICIAIFSVVKSIRLHNRNPLIIALRFVGDV